MRGHLIVWSVLLASCSGAKAPATTPTPTPDPVPAVEGATPAASKPAPAPDPIDAKVRAMGQIKRAFSPSFSPDGERLAFISDAGGLPEVYVVPVAGGAPERITKLQDPVGGVAWSPDGAWLAISVAPGGGLNSQIYLLRPDGSELTRITDGGKVNNWLGGWSRDGALLALSSNRRDPAAMDGYVYDVAAKQLVLVSKNTGTGTVLDVTPDKKRVLAQRVAYRGNNNLYVIDRARGPELLLTPHDGPAQFNGQLSADGKTVYLSSNKGRDLIAFGKIKLGPGKRANPIELIAAREDAELAEFKVSDQGTAALVWNVGGKRELALIDLATKKPIAAPPLPRELAFAPTFSKDGKRLAVILSGSASPVDIWVLDAGAWRQVTKSAHDGVALDEFVRPELVRFPAHDGLELSGWLYRPRGASGPGPIVLSFHGGPEGQEIPSLQAGYQALLAKNIAVLAPNVRGSSGFGKKFVNLDNGALRANAIKDIKACVDYVVGAKIADPKRIGITGGSYGGYMTMAGVTEYPELFAAGANLFGIVNFATFFQHSEGWMGAVSKIEYGDPVKEAEMLKQLSPIHRIDRITAPIMVLHGANDTNVPVIEAEQVVASLKKRGVPVEYVLFPDEGHGWQKSANRIRSIVEITRWFDTHLNRR